MIAENSVKAFKYNQVKNKVDKNAINYDNKNDDIVEDDVKKDGFALNSNI